MNETLKRCGSCRTGLKFLKREKIQLGQTGFVLGDLPNLLAGAQELEFWVCPNCRKLELFIPENAPLDEGDFEEDGIARRTCPVCGMKHDMDDPKCPHCGAKNKTLYEP